MAVLSFQRMRQDCPDYQDADFSSMLAIWGNGNANTGFALFFAVTMRLVHARTKHPLYAEGRFQALGVIGAEYEELVQAVENESAYRQQEEAKDVIATCLRFLNSEHEKSGL